MSEPRGRTLRRALDIAGSRERLADVLGVAREDLDAYLDGKRPVPDAVFHTALDIVARGQTT